MKFISRSACKIDILSVFDSGLLVAFGLHGGTAILSVAASPSVGPGADLDQGNFVLIVTPFLLRLLGNFGLLRRRLILIDRLIFGMLALFLLWARDFLLELVSITHESRGGRQACTPLHRRHPRHPRPLRPLPSSHDLGCHAGLAC